MNESIYKKYYIKLLNYLQIIILDDKYFSDILQQFNLL